MHLFPPSIQLLLVICPTQSGEIMLDKNLSSINIWNIYVVFVYLSLLHLKSFEGLLYSLVIVFVISILL